MPACLHPTITLKKSAFNEYARAHSESKFWRDNLGVNRDFAYTRTVFPCGKCINCLRKKQNQVVVRLQEESKKYSEVAFVTLTYNEDRLPLSCSLWSCDPSTGECFLESTPDLLSRRSSKTFEVFCRSSILSLKRSRFPRYVDYNLFDGRLLNGRLWFVRVTPTVNRLDFRLWLKSCRVAYEREFGEKLPDFKYSMSPEYSFKSCRPHYHCLFFGLTRKQVYWMTARWSREFGFVWNRFVPAVNKDGSNGYQLLSRYVSKYVTKGSFECSSVKDRCAEKPRVCQSKGLGGDLAASLRDYVCCFDLFGKYDLDTLSLSESGVRLSSDQINSLVSEIPRRLSFSPDGKFYYPLPRGVVDSIFKVRIVTKTVQSGLGYEKDKIVFRKTKIWSLVTDHLFSITLDLYHSQLQLFLSERNFREVSEGLVAFQVHQNLLAESSQEIGAKKLFGFYSKSKH